MGIIGAFLVLWGYWRKSNKISFFGGLFLLVYAISIHSFSFILLNAIWTLIALWRMKRRW